MKDLKGLLDLLDLYSEATEGLSREKRREFADFFIGALSADVRREVWVKCLELTKRHIKEAEQDESV